eukprot:790798_1
MSRFNIVIRGPLQMREDVNNNLKRLQDIISAETKRKKAFNTRQTAVRDLVVLWLELQVAGGVESVREQILANKWAKNDIHVMRLYKWIIKLGARLEPSKYVNPHQAVENLANFFTK